ncbi:MAG: hypothetical protein JW840_07955 [Candidatus Thermoplasmatota archaeon]|nr:hypothetical protein [Candidatus Thermoplasmatota archaeon]
MKRTIWHKYYSEHKKKYKMWNKNWREKQNNKSYHLFFLHCHPIHIRFQSMYIIR